MLILSKPFVTFNVTLELKVGKLRVSGCLLHFAEKWEIYPSLDLCPILVINIFLSSYLNAKLSTRRSIS